MAKDKKRLDILLYERGLAPTRSKAQALIMAGDVRVDGQVVSKSGMKFELDTQIEVRQPAQYVSRGGEKLAGALAEFGLDVSDRVAVDVGASTGGFSDCLLQNNVQRVYAIDVGYGQLAHKIRVDERVVVMERTNARHVEDLPEPIDLVVADASFISLRLLLPSIIKWVAPQSDIIALIKPQFEAGKSDVAKGGVVRDVRVHRRVLREVISFALSLDLKLVGLMMSPIKGLKEGNTEFLVWLQYGGESPTLDLKQAVDQVLHT